MRHVAVPTNTILGSTDAPVSAQWHSENESVQARTAALVACGDSEDLAIAGVSTARGEGTHPYFVWNPAAAAQEELVVDRRAKTASSTEMSEYMQRYRAFSATETVIMR